MELSEQQRNAASDHLSRNPKTCKCGSTDWEIGEQGDFIPDVSSVPRKIKPDSPYIILTCRGCENEENIDFREANIPDE